MTNNRKDTVIAVAYLLRGVEAGTIDKPLLASAASNLIHSAVDNDDYLLKSVTRFMDGLLSGMRERSIADQNPVVMDALAGAVLLVSGKLE